MHGRSQIPIANALACMQLVVVLAVIVDLVGVVVIIVLASLGNQILNAR